MPDVKVGGRVLTSDIGAAKMRKHAQILDCWHAKNFIDNHVVPKAKWHANRAALMIKARDLTTNNDGEHDTAQFSSVDGSCEQCNNRMQAKDNMKHRMRG
jgi:hypothetical protein